MQLRRNEEISAERLNAGLTRLVVAFAPIESKGERLTLRIACDTTSYASVQIVPFLKLSRSKRKRLFYFFFLFLFRHARGPSPLFKPLCGLPTEANSMTLQFARREFSVFEFGVSSSIAVTTHRDGQRPTSGAMMCRSAMLLKKRQTQKLKTPYAQTESEQQEAESKHTILNRDLSSLL